MSTSTIAQAVLECERQRCDALLRGDMAALEKLLADQLIFTHANATQDTKQSLLAKLGTGTIQYRSLTVDEERIIECGDCVILSARLQAIVEVAGVTKTIRNSTLSVWSNEDGEWRLIAYQPTAIPA